MHTPGAVAQRRRLSFDQAVIAWRFWDISGEQGERRLRSPFRDTVWPTSRPLLAVCLSSYRSLEPAEAPHQPPAEACRCGVYGGTYDGLRAFLGATINPPAEPTVLGRARLWGDVIVEKTAWRASHAYAELLLVPTLVPDAYRIAKELEEYRVPVAVLDVVDTYATLNPGSHRRRVW
jgi:hypothetical protein